MAFSTIKSMAERVREQDPAARLYLGVDFGTRMGLAIRHLDGRYAHSMVQFSKGSHPGVKFKNFRGWLTQTKNAHGLFDRVFFERIDFSNYTEAARSTFGFEATLLAWCCLYNIAVTPIANGTHKKFTAGHGRADKEQTMQALRDLGHQVFDDNAADALSILRCGLQDRSPI